MPTTTVTVKYLNQPKTEKGPGSIKDETGRYFKCWKEKLSQFEVGKTYQIEYSEGQYQGKPDNTVTKVLSTSTTQTGGGNGSDGTATASAPRQYDAVRSARIERQHSQHMALLFLQANCAGAGELFQKAPEAALRQWTDYFQLDLDNAPQKPVVEQAKEILNATEVNGAQKASW